jgi:protein phosphatase PTC6
VTDGLTSLISNQEICDLTRGAKDPTKAAQAILKFAEDLDPQDNCTCMVIPLKGWGKVKGEDMTRDRREYRRRQASTTALKTMIRG